MVLKFTCVVLLLSVVFLSVNAKDKNIKQQDGDTCTDVAFRHMYSISLSSSDRERLRKIRPPELSWMQTPSIVTAGPGHYQAVGRVIHLKYLKEQLERQKKFNFDATRGTMDNFVKRLDIFADTLYLEGTVKIYGIKEIKIYVREITATYGSHVYFGTPNWKEEYKTRVVNGMGGEDGKDGLDGPEVDIFCDVANGIFTITSKGGDGKKGQDGGDGAKVQDSGNTKSDKSTSLCTVSGDGCRSYYIAGEPGVMGPRGRDGGNAGKPGNGATPGWMYFRARMINGEVNVHACRGDGAVAATNGRGGQGGAGGYGGRGRRCRDVYGLWVPVCSNSGQTARAARGPRGPSGKSGTTSQNPGGNGNTDYGYVNLARGRYELDAASKRSYPMAVINIIRRQAEDLLLGNSDDQKGKDALQFILSLANERSDLEEMKKDVKRKLGFLGKEGYDIFGMNKMFAPRVKWQSLEDTAKDTKNAAQSYENAFNGIISDVKGDQNFQTMASKMSAVGSLQVNAEKKRLEEARIVAKSEKRAYVKSIKQLEEQMSSILTNVNSMFADVYKNAKFHAGDFLALLQGIVGFSSAIASKNPFDFINSAIGVAQSTSGKSCLKSLESYLGSIKSWLTFGENYKPLVSSSDLDFDQLNVSSVPHIMQANLEMNKEKFTAELVCLLEVASRPQDVAEFKQLVESFFFAGAARINLIAEIMNLDNTIGGQNFDIPLLAQTEQAIKDAAKTKGAPITTRLQQTFMDNLIGTYRELERSFMRNVYELYKAFAFRTLWDADNPLATFRRVASESARGTGRLNGVVQLAQVLQRINVLKDQANKCFTYNKYATDIHKWSFNSVKDKKMFQELASKGRTRFTINIDKSCKTCYNVRLLKIYIELRGKEDQPANVPQKVYLQVRHRSGSFFRAGDKTIKQYYQPIASYRNIKFNRLTLSDKNKCNERKKKGENLKPFCVIEDDSRWEAMCNHALNKRGSHNKDALLGMEECQSPFGIYELKIPVDKDLACDADGITNRNCKDLDLTKFTEMNVWTHYVFWAGEYPTGPDDIVCQKSQQKKKNETVVFDQGFHAAIDSVDKF